MTAWAGRKPRIGILGIMQDLYDDMVPGIAQRQEGYAAELVGHRGDHARDGLAARRPRGRVGGVRVHHAADLGHVPVDVGVRGGVARRAQAVLRHWLAVQVADHHRLRGQVVVGHAARLDHHELRGPRDAGRHVARRPGHQAVADQFGVQRAHGLPQRHEPRSLRAHRAPPSSARSRMARSRYMTSLAPRPK